MVGWVNQGYHLLGKGGWRWTPPLLQQDFIQNSFVAYLRRLKYLLPIMRESPPPRSHVSFETRWGWGRGRLPLPPPPSQTGNPVDRGLLGFFTLFQAHAFLFSHAGIKDVYSVQCTSHHASHQYTSHIFLSSHFHHLLCTAAQTLKKNSRSDDQNSQKF